MGFVGRRTELARLGEHFDAVRRGRGRLLSVRGRRQVGKSRLVTEFARTADVPLLYLTATQAASVRVDLARFASAAAASSLPSAGLFAGISMDSWEGAFRTLATALAGTGPAIVVLDEFPWFVGNDAGLEGALQVAWDRTLEGLPLLMVLVGSDLAMMSALTEHDRPLYGRAREFVLNPLSPADTAHMVRLPAADALDAYLVSGGYPRLLGEWARGERVEQFLTRQLADPTSDLIVTGARMLAAEFPAHAQAATVLRAIGSGERTFGNIRAAVEIEASPLTRALRLLAADKRVVARDLPVSARISKEARYRVADPFLRFWLRFVEPALADIERGRADLARARVLASWPDYRGRAVEPLVREALTRLAADDPRLGGAAFVGGWWPRSNDPEVDLVGVDRGPGRANSVCFVGSVKWRERAGFDDRDLAALRAAADVVPGASTSPLVAVTRTGRVGASAARTLAAAYGPADLLAAWT